MCVCVGGGGGVPVYQKLTGGCIVGLLHVCVCVGGGGGPVYQKLTGGCIVGLLHVCVCGGGGGGGVSCVSETDWWMHCGFVTCVCVWGGGGGFLCIRN